MFRFCLLTLCTFGSLLCLAEDGWTRVFHDSFERQELGADWRVLEGDWRLEDGDLVTEGLGVIAIDREVEGCQRLEFVASSTQPGDLTPMLHMDGEHPNSGYFLQFGGINNTKNKGRRLKSFITLDTDHMIEPGKQHRIVAELDGVHLRLTVDGELVHNYLEVDEPLLGEGHRYAGIYIYTRGRIHEATLSTRPWTGWPEDLPRPEKRQVKPGDNLLLGGDGEDRQALVKWGGIAGRRTDEAHRGEACLEIASTGSANTPGLVELDPDATYELSGWFKSALAEQPSRVLVDWRFYTADKRAITPISIRPDSSVSSLIAPAAKGDRLVRVAKADWKVREKRRQHLVFGAKEDLSDLPNFSAILVEELKEAEDHYLIELNAPLPSDQPVGSGVRLHLYLDHPRIVINPVPTEWTHASMRLSRDVQPGDRVQNHLWPGTHYVKINLIHQYTGYPQDVPDGKPQPHLLFDDLTLKRLDPPQD